MAVAGAGRGSPEAYGFIVCFEIAKMEKTEAWQISKGQRLYSLVRNRCDGGAATWERRERSGAASRASKDSGDELLLSSFAADFLLAQPL